VSVTRGKAPPGLTARFGILPATRYDKTARNFLAAVYLAATVITLN